MEPVASLKPISRDFFWDETQRRGTGWHPTTQPTFDAGSAFHVAHDVLEHLDQHNSSLETEMKAFGVHLYLRGVTPYWKMKDDLIRAVNGRRDVEEQIMRILSGNQHTDDAAYHISGDLFQFLGNDRRWLSAATDHSHVEYTAERVLRDSVHLAEMKYGEHLMGTDNRSHQPWRERIEYAMDWVRVGYREAQQRYTGLSESTRARMFLAVEETVMRHSKRHLDELQQGDTMNVTVSFSDTGNRVTTTIKGRELYGPPAMIAAFL